MALQGDFTEAAQAFSTALAMRRDALTLYNRGIVLINLGRMSEAKSDFQESTGLRGDNTSDFMFLGMVNWLMGNQSEAVKAWHQGLNAKFTDAAGGVELPGILLYAAHKTRDALLEKECLSLLNKRWKPNRVQVWPAPIAGLHLGRVNSDTLEQSMSSQPRIRAKEKCQVDFHVGLQFLRQGRPEEAKRWFVSAASPLEALGQPERYLAKAEVEELLREGF